MKDAAARLAEEALYEQVASEISAGVRRDGLWAKAIAECGGSQENARATYIKLRVQSIIDESMIKEEIEKHKAAHMAETTRKKEAEAIKLRVEEIAKKDDDKQKENMQRITSVVGKLVFGFVALITIFGLISVISEVFNGGFLMLPVAVIYGVIIWWSIKKLREGAR